MFDGQFGAAGDTVVIEEFLEGEEASFIAIVSGEHILPLATSQDHKRRDDADRGPNTGGMGAYSPAPVVTDAIHRRIMREVMEPTVAASSRTARPTWAFCTPALMIAPDGTPNVLEFNCRFGDPETQPIMMRLTIGSDRAVRCGDRRPTETDRSDLGPARGARRRARCRRLSGSSAKGDVIDGLDAAARLPGKVFHAATQLVDGKVVTNGGRVLCAVGLGSTVSEAQRAAYALCDQIHWSGMHYRRDIGYRAIAREQG